MGTINEYKCSNCGYELKFLGGTSGINENFRIALYCSKAKEVFVLSPEPLEGEDNKYKAVECPDCRNHNLNEKWDYETCPKCNTKNKLDCVGNWD